MPQSEVGNASGRYRTGAEWIGLTRKEKKAESARPGLAVVGFMPSQCGRERQSRGRVDVAPPDCGYIQSVTTHGSTSVLPVAFRRYFWDVDPDGLSWPHWREFIIGRLLGSGDREAVRWLLDRVTPLELADWLRRRRGGGLSPQRLRFWQLMLRLPAAEVDAWIARATSASWGVPIRQ
jgi:hypothetical protein